MSPGYRRPGADSDNSLYPDREPCDIIGVARCDDRKDRDMDQAQLLSLIGSLYDQLVEDVAQRVATMNKESLAYLVDASVTESIDARIQTWAGYNLSDAIATWVENNLDLDDRIENWVENNLDLEDAAREAVGEIDLGDSVREIIKNELTFSVSVD